MTPARQIRSYPLYRTHWHLGYCNKTARGILVYKTAITDEFDTRLGKTWIALRLGIAFRKT